MILCTDGTRHFAAAVTAYREARDESELAQVAVIWTLRNRAEKGSWWGHSIDQCAFKKWQYSSLTDPHDHQLTTWGLAGEPAWETAWRLAGEVLAGEHAHPMPGADSYFDSSIAPPKWVPSARYCGQIGRLKFFDVDHDYEAPITGHA
jgi:spore germination cell wall hydrolase CwlJ-like protein